MSLYTLLCQLLPLFFDTFSPLAARQCWRSTLVWQGIPHSGLDVQLQTTPDPSLSHHLLCRGPWRSLECRSPQVTDKARWKGGFVCACLKEVHAIKNSPSSCQCIAIKNSWAGLLSAFSHVRVDSPFVPLSCHNSPFTATLCWLLCASAITEAKSAS